MKKPKRLKPEKPAYKTGFNHQIWRVVDGAIRDAFIHHPDYLTGKGTSGASARRSVAKRVTGAVLSYLKASHDASRQGRSGPSKLSLSGDRRL